MNSGLLTSNDTKVLAGSLAGSLMRTLSAHAMPPTETYKHKCKFPYCLIVIPYKRELTT